MTWNAAVYCTPVVRDSLIVFAALNVDLQAAAKTPLRFGLPQGGPAFFLRACKNRRVQSPRASLKRGIEERA
jgi:hypothetical protein